MKKIWQLFKSLFSPISFRICEHHCALSSTMGERAAICKGDKCAMEKTK